jgi:glycosyltransferase involved in cell wall biosynthesis
MISIIVPNYNHRKFLPQRLDTIFNQTFQDFEVILLDDFSTDGSWEYLRQFENHPKVTYCVRNEVNSGSPFKQWKKGLGLAKFEWIWIAESDDFSELDFLEKLIAQFDDEIVLVFANSEFVDETGSTLFFNGKKHEMKSYQLGEDSFRKLGVKFIKEFLIYRNYILNANAVLFRKPDNFPNEPLTMRFAGDWYFWIYILRIGDIVYLPSPSNYFRFHHSTTRSIRDELTELSRFKEDILCVNLAKEISGRSTFSLFNDFNFLEMIQGHFKLRWKYGRLRFFSIFPKIPLVFYPMYYKFFLASLIQKK